ncbi:MAG: TetR/AcrR family transcriptional regulator [Bacteroidota bacterium]
MRPQKVDTEVMMQGLMRVLRNRGYDGASLKELAEATGLKKASLYHRFPGGKQEMAEAVLSHMHEWSNQHIHNLLQDKTYPAAERLEQVLQNVNRLYAGGDISCIFRALSTEFGLDLFGDQLERGMRAWIRAFNVLGEDFGFTAELSHRYALQTVVEIQGALVVGKCLAETSVFQRTTEQIRQRYLLSEKS